MTVRIYDAKSRQWSIYWANHSDGRFSLPATVGQFENGRGDSCRFEQSFSDDGEKTWEVNWVNTYTRVENETAKSH